MCISFAFTHTATTDLYTLSLHDALPICHHQGEDLAGSNAGGCGSGEEDLRCEVGVEGIAARDEIGGGLYRRGAIGAEVVDLDRKSTRLNSSHRTISYAVFCLKKKNKDTQ